MNLQNLRENVEHIGHIWTTASVTGDKIFGIS